MEHKLPVAVVCRVLGAPRSTIYARRASAGGGGRPGPATSISDLDLLGLIRRVCRPRRSLARATTSSARGCVASMAYR
jgi:hypothetical protein